MYHVVLTSVALGSKHSRYRSSTRSVGVVIPFHRSIPPFHSTVPFIPHPTESAAFQPLEDAIHQQFIPALTGHAPCSTEMRRLLSLPTRNGGLNIVNIAERQMNASKAITTVTPLKEMIMHRPKRLIHKTQLKLIKAQLLCEKCQHTEATVQEVREQIPAPLQRAMDLGSEKGSSTWLTALPLQDQGFKLSDKQEFQDALCLRYNWQLTTPASQQCIGDTNRQRRQNMEIE